MHSDSSVLPVGQAPRVSLVSEDDTDVYAVPEAARRAGVSRAWYYRAARQGRVPAKFLGRRVVVPKVQFHQFLAGTWAGEPAASLTAAGGEVA
jgi:excisionase family DNA binding protein